MIRALRSRWSSFRRDPLLVAVLAVAVVLPLTVLIALPADLRSALAPIRAGVATEIDGLVTLVVAAVAAIYGSGRYTVDHRDGVIAREAAMLHRSEILLSRLLFAVLAGAAVGVVGALSGGLVVGIAAGWEGRGAGSVGATGVVDAALGAICAGWGLSVGILVRHHLPALVMAPLLLSAVLAVAPMAPGVAAWFPLPLIAEAVGAELSVAAPGRATAIVLAALGIAALLCAAAVRFLRTDIR